MTDHDDVFDRLRRARPENLPDELASPTAPAAQALLEEILSMETFQPTETEAMSNGHEVPITRRRPRRRLVAAGAVVAAAAAIAATVLVGATTLTPGEQQAAAATVDDALAKSSEALSVSGRAEVVWHQSGIDAEGNEIPGDGGTWLLEYSGTNRASTILAWVGGRRDRSDAQHEAHRLVDGVDYRYAENPDGQFAWYHDPDDVNNPEMFHADPATLLEDLRPAGDFEEVGTETIDGVQVRRLRALHPDATPPLPALSTFGNEMLGDPLGEVTNLEVWVDDDGIVHRLDISLHTDYPPTDDPSAPIAATSTSSFHFFDLAQPITIEAPPDAANLPEVDEMYD